MNVLRAALILVLLYAAIRVAISIQIPVLEHKPPKYGRMFIRQLPSTPATVSKYLATIPKAVPKTKYIIENASLFVDLTIPIVNSP